MYLFIITHYGSPAKQLCEELDKHPYMRFANVGNYNHGTDLIKMKEYGDKHTRIWFDCLYENETFACPSLYSHAKFIYLLGTPEQSLAYLVGIKGYSPHGAMRYYTYRLRRMYEMFHHAPGLLTEGDGIFTFLGIKDYPLSLHEEVVPKVDIPYEIKQAVEKRYEFYRTMLMKIAK